MKKRAISVLLTLVLLVGILPMSVLKARAGGWLEDYTWDEESATLTIHSMDDPYGYLSGSDAKWYAEQIPWRMYCEQAKCVIIDDGVEEILPYAFYEYPLLETVFLPESILSLGHYAFSGCSSLQSIVIPDHVTEIGDSAFWNCTGLVSASIGCSVKSIGVLAFFGCSEMNAISIPATVNYIGGSAFSYCENLVSFHVADENQYFASIDGVLFNKHITTLYQYPPKKADEIYIVPDSVTKISDYAFELCTTLSQIVLPDSITSIGNYSFANCDSLTQVNVPSKVTRISEGAYAGCDRLTEIVLPDHVTHIDQNAFSSCSSLTVVQIGSNVDQIDDNAFGSCENLRAVYFYGDAPLLGEDVFCVLKEYDSELGEFVYEPLPHITLFYLADKVGWTSPEWNGYPTGVWTLGEHMHSYVMDVVSPTCTERGYSTFACGCGDSFIGNDMNPLGHDYSESGQYCMRCAICYPAEGGNIYIDSETGTVAGCDKSVTSAKIPTEVDGITVTSIGYRAFSDCKELHTVVIPDSIVSIGEHAFSNCYSLMDVAIPDRVTEILDSTFSDCSSMISVDIGCNVKSIGAWAFSGCTNLEKVNIGEAVEVIDEYAFYICDSLETLLIPESVISIDEYAFAYCQNLQNIVVNENNGHYRSIDGVLFNQTATTVVYYPTGRTDRSYEIPSTVNAIGDGTFTGCKLESVYICHAVERIGKHSFFECNNLQSVFFYGDAPEIGNNAFYTIDYSMENWWENYFVIPGLTFYYIEGKEGWTTPTWNGYPTATWEPSEPEEPVEFVDVPEGIWYTEAVRFAVKNGLFNGMSETTFEPETAMTRAMLVTVLWRYAGQPAEGTNIFTDVPANVWYTQAVAWAAENGIVTGIGGGRFDPDGQITREQLAVILYRYCKAIGIDTSPSAELSAFPDAAKVSPYAAEALSWAVKTGLVTGSASGGKVYLEPQGKATRAQVATILMRFIQNVVE